MSEDNVITVSKCRKHLSNKVLFKSEDRISSKTKKVCHSYTFIEENIYRYNSKADYYLKTKELIKLSSFSK